MRALWIEPFAGIAGDMTVAALLDLGFPEEALRDGLEKLGLTGYRCSVRKVERRGFAGTKFEVEVTEDQTHRNLGDIAAILMRGELPARVRERSRGAFEALAEAEARAHGCDVADVHFHEVGAVDAIVDVVGSALGLEHFGVDVVFCSRVRVGTGEVECRHGTIPVPAPAALRLLRDFPMQVAEGEGETVTPTGAAILRAWARPLGPDLPLTVRATGYGAGSREGTRLPNMLRISVVDVEEGPGPEGAVTELAANLDDLSPELLAFAQERLLAAGALDAWATPVLMKKGRPGFVLSALAGPGREAALEKVFFAETTTLGVRRTPVLRSVLDRRRIEVETSYGRVGVKVGGREGEPTVLAPEYEDCARAARERGVPLRVIYAAALEAAGELLR